AVDLDAQQRDVGFFGEEALHQRQRRVALRLELVAAGLVVDRRHHQRALPHLDGRQGLVGESGRGEGAQQDRGEAHAAEGSKAMPDVPGYDAAINRGSAWLDCNVARIGVSRSRRDCTVGSTTRVFIPTTSTSAPSLSSTSPPWNELVRLPAASRSSQWVSCG